MTILTDLDIRQNRYGIWSVWCFTTYIAWSTDLEELRKNYPMAVVKETL